MADAGKHVVAIVGGATSGAEAAAVLADKGVEVVVFEMNPRPFGKIEDGLPRWHAKQRRDEYQNIGAKLKKPGVHFVPNTKLGRDVKFEELAKAWGFSALLLANGAWRDRPLLPGAEAYVGQGLVYQNALVYWFNHHVEKGFKGERFEIPEGAVIVGGGLASFDVVKICMIETVTRALEKRGIHAHMHDLEKTGIPKTLAGHGLTLETLGVKPCVLYYRRRAKDMPIAEIPKDATPEERAKREGVREKILKNLVDKFGFVFQPLHAPEGLIVEGGRCVGVTFSRTDIVNGKVVKVPGPPVAARSSMVISSIGSIPDPVPGVEMVGEYYKFGSEETGEYLPVPGVFGLGNVITGKGNIRVSMMHGRQIAESVSRRYLGLDGSDGPLPPTAAQQAGAAAAEQVAAHLETKAPLAPAQAKAVLGRVQQRQKQVGYDGFDSWIARVTPADLE